MKDIKTKQRVKLALILSALSIICIVGGTYAWFSATHRLNSISLVQVPSKITISGSKRTEMTRINLELTEDDTKKGNIVTINRVFCIESTEDFYLEVAHTTNINNMQISIFPVSVNNSEIVAEARPNGAISAGVGSQTYYYIPDQNPLSGIYMNSKGSIATEEYHDLNYSDGDVVQINAEPLFWITYADDYAVEKYDKTGYSYKGKAADGVTEVYYRYYILQLSWDSDTLETDLVYLMASHPEN